MRPVLRLLLMGRRRGDIPPMPQEVFLRASLIISLSLSLASCNSIYQTAVSGNPTSATNVTPIFTEQSATLATLTPMTTLPSTIVKTPTSAPTVIAPPPTLQLAEQTKLLFQLISNNGGCNLPCWWGLQPGTSTWQDVLDTLHYLKTGLKPPPSVSIPITTSPLIQSYKLNGVPIIFVDDVAPIHLFFTDDVVGTIQSIRVSIQSPSFFASVPDYAYSMRQYFIDSVLSQYGKPSDIFIQLTAARTEPEAPFLYNIWMFYNDIGVITHFEGEHRSPQQDKIQVCPEYETVWYIDLYLHYAVMPDFSGAKPLEDVSNLDVNSFYETFIQPKSLACFESSVDFWPLKNF